MRLYIHDKCMDKLFDLPKNISKRVLEFQKKFREDSRSASINLEPISTFKDPLLRTARITDQYRAIIRVPESGKNYYLLWVDNHDEAMDWAKNKVFQWNENTQSAQIFTSFESTETAGDKAFLKPESQYEVSMFGDYSDEDLKAIGVPESQTKLVKGIRDFDEFERAEKFLPSDAFENLFYLSDGLSIELLIAEINEGKTTSGDPDEQAESINNKRSFVEVDDKLLNDIINGDLDKWQVFLHPSQRKLVDTEFKGSVKVTGGAGTGKTVVALHRLKHLSNHLQIGDGRKVLFTTFTNALTQNLEKLSKKMGIDPSRVILTNIDSLVRELAGDYGLIDKSIRILDLYNTKRSCDVWDEILEQNLSQFDYRFLSSEYQDVLLYHNIQTLEQYLKVSRLGRGKPITRKQKMEVWSIVEAYNDYKVSESYMDRAELFNKVTDHLQSNTIFPFRHVIADEIQDMSNVELRFLRALVEEKSNDLFLVGDPYQKIYARKINFSQAGISLRGKRSRQLRINYRTSEEIKRLALSAIKGINYDDFDGEEERLNGYLSLFHGEAPTYEIFKTKEEESNTILNHIKELKESGIKYNEIAIGFRKRNSMKEIKTLLHHNKIPYTDNTNPGEFNHEGVMLSTFHSLKGLEFKAVILGDVNNRTCPLYHSGVNDMDDIERQEHMNSEKSLLYVAVSRAISILRITGTGMKSELILMQNL